MKTRWIALLVSLAAAHFAATAGAHLYTSANCQKAPGSECQLIAATASVLSLPLLPIALQFSSGMGWRRAFVVFSANSVLVSVLLSAAIWLLARSLRAGRVALYEGDSVKPSSSGEAGGD